MNASSVDPQDQRQMAALQQRLQLERKFINGVNWFFWIAGLSIVNTLVFLFGAGFVFVLGLGATQLVDGIVSAIVEGAGSSATVFRVLGVAVNLGIAGLFVVFGLLGRRRSRAAIIVGMLLYALDAILVVAFGDYIGGAFHAWALFGIFTGLRALGQLEAKPKLPGSEVIQTLD